MGGPEVGTGWDPRGARPRYPPAMNTRWPDLTAALQPLTPPGLVLRQAASTDVVPLIAALAAWYPALAVAQVGFMLSPAFYADQVALADVACTLEDRPCVTVVAERDGQLVSCLLLTVEDDGRTLAGTMTVVSPDAYGMGLGGVAARTTVAVAQAVGADIAYALAELDNHASRKALETAGLVLCGVVPASDRKPKRGGGVTWVAEALYVRTLTPEAARVWPSRATLTPATDAMFRGLWGFAAPASFAVVEAVGPRLTGVDARCRLVPVRDRAAQEAAEAEGMQLLGLVPGSDRHKVDGVTVFGFEALYGAASHVMESSAWPALSGLPPRLAALVDAVRGPDALAA